jgi:hypothetical protein
VSGLGRGNNCCLRNQCLVQSGEAGEENVHGKGCRPRLPKRGGEKARSVGGQTEANPFALSRRGVNDREQDGRRNEGQFIYQALLYSIHFPGGLIAIRDVAAKRLPSVCLVERAHCDPTAFGEGYLILRQKTQLGVIEEANSTRENRLTLHRTLVLSYL